jgi:hypothetical protein
MSRTARTLARSGVVATCVAIVLAGCGGGAHANDASSSTFADGAQRVCAAYFKQAYALPPPIGYQGLERLLERQYALGEQELSQLRQLTPPSAERARYERYLADLAAREHLAAVAIEAVTDKRPLRGEPADESTRLGAAAEAEARALGLAECAKNPYTASHTYSSSSG